MKTSATIYDKSRLLFLYNELVYHCINTFTKNTYIFLSCFNSNLPHEK